MTNDHRIDCSAEGASILFGGLFALAVSSLEQADVLIGSSCCAVAQSSPD